MTSIEPAWLNSAGGPLILLQASDRLRWRGVGTELTDKSHYALACSVRESVGLVRFDGITGLILGDEPNSTAIFSVSETSFALVRWICADEAGDMVAAAYAAIHHRLNWIADEVYLCFRDSQIVLFDSALDGSMAVKPDVLETRISPGVYSLKSILVTSGSTEALIHRLDLVQSFARNSVIADMG